MNEYIPAYLAAIQDDINAILTATESAAESIEHSTEYENNFHPFHAAAVSAYNRLVTTLITLQGYQTTQ